MTLNARLSKEKHVVTKVLNGATGMNFTEGDGKVPGERFRCDAVGGRQHVSVADQGASTSGDLFL